METEQLTKSGNTDKKQGQGLVPSASRNFLKAMNFDGLGQ